MMQMFQNAIHFYAIWNAVGNLEACGILVIVANAICSKQNRYYKGRACVQTSFQVFSFSLRVPLQPLHCQFEVPNCASTPNDGLITNLVSRGESTGEILSGVKISNSICTKFRSMCLSEKLAKIADQQPLIVCHARFHLRYMRHHHSILRCCC